LRVAILAAVAAAIVLSAAPVPGNSAKAASSDAIPFTSAQATLGAKVYLQSCASCHGTNLHGISGPALVGKTSGIAQQSLVEVYEYVSQQMPQTAPGSLSKAQYASILAFIAQKNGHRPGSLPLTQSVETTDSATIEAHR